MKTSIQLSLLLLTLVSFNLAAETQICNENMIETAPESRFTINGDGTVTDKQTNLIWARCPQGLSGSDCTVGELVAYSWVDALALNGTRPTSVTAGPVIETDWRLPNAKELESLGELSCSNPAINQMVFPNTLAEGDSRNPGVFWSSTSVPNTTSRAWTVFFISFVTGFPNGLAVPYGVRLVRGGQ